MWKRFKHQDEKEEKFMMNQERREDLEEWLKLFIPLYDNASPILHGIAGFDPKLKSKERLQTAVMSLQEGRFVLPSITDAAKNLPKPKDHLAGKLRKHFVDTLTFAITACHFQAKYEGQRSRMSLSQIVLYTGMTQTSLQDLMKTVNSMGLNTAKTDSDSQK